MQADLQPLIFNSLVQPSLKIGISDSDEMITSQYAASDYLILHKMVMICRPMSSSDVISRSVTKMDAVVSVSVWSRLEILERSLSEEVFN